MASMLVKDIDGELLREVNYRAKGEGLTQREWVIKVLGEALGGNVKSAAEGGSEKDHGKASAHRGGQGGAGVQAEAVPMGGGIRKDSGKQGKGQGRGEAGRVRELSKSEQLRALRERNSRNG